MALWKYEQEDYLTVLPKEGPLWAALLWFWSKKVTLDLTLRSNSRPLSGQNTSLYSEHMTSTLFFQMRNPRLQEGLPSITKCTNIQGSKYPSPHPSPPQRCSLLGEHMPSIPLGSPPWGL